jgi:hypothetical protein
LTKASHGRWSRETARTAPSNTQPPRRPGTAKAVRLSVWTWTRTPTRPRPPSVRWASTHRRSPKLRLGKRLRPASTREALRAGPATSESPRATLANDLPEDVAHRTGAAANKAEGPRRTLCLRRTQTAAEPGFGPGNGPRISAGSQPEGYPAVDEQVAPRERFAQGRSTSHGGSRQQGGGPPANSPSPPDTDRRRARIRPRKWTPDFSRLAARRLPSR